ATILWCYLLSKRAGRSFAAALIGAFLFVGSSFWLEQAISLKQYSLDVLFALIPFLVSDDFFTSALAQGKMKARLALLTAPFFLSYTYPPALAARILGWYLKRGRRQSWKLTPSSLVILAGAAGLSLFGIWATDYRFGADLTDYWADCILRTHLLHG